jgi:prepilin-type N-terminal cleavage/methylation domain-containing protein
MKNKKFKKRGFTLIEILIVLGIIAILAAIVVVAINPAKQFAQARNTERTANITSILNAVGQRLADNKGVFAGTFSIGTNNYICGPLPNASTNISSNMATDTTTQTGDLGCLVPTYIATLPTEPAGASASQYTVQLLSTGRITICAPEAQNEVSIPNPSAICVTR